MECVNTNCVQEKVTMLDYKVQQLEKEVSMFREVIDPIKTAVLKLEIITTSLADWMKQEQLKRSRLIWDVIKVCIIAIGTFMVGYYLK